MMLPKSMSKNHDLNIDQNNLDYNLCHNRAALSGIKLCPIDSEMWIIHCQTVYRFESYNL